MFAVSAHHVSVYTRFYALSKDRLIEVGVAIIVSGLIAFIYCTKRLLSYSLCHFVDVLSSASADS